MRRTLTGVALAAASALCMGVGTAAAATTTTQVTQNDVTAATACNVDPAYGAGKTWRECNRDAGTGDFVVGPAAPPLGLGSWQMSTPGGNDKVTLFTNTWGGTALSAVDTLGYSSYRSAGSAQQAPALNMTVDVNGAATGGFTTLVFEPVYNTDQGAVVSGQWQAWSAAGSGRWWSTRDIPSTCAVSCYSTFSAIQAANPDAVVLEYGVNQGGGNPGLVGAVDGLEIGASGNSTKYDFEPLVGPPSSKDECKGDGFTKFNNPPFKNQGDCVSLVASKK